ncbi:RWD domain-containing protein 2B [Callorhinchus milii]|uniref:RWD domain containing 2B n=1 Tax=Callorhinchus milii TaxID=7868 RepID=V9L2X6_CALMI|nr:RWD domain-containing protein 2B [Callorhinchus milii]XP_042189896.1 RWD domain-containing protein 2B [Callorhinchus milii]|eukprot:gi/632937367/ref/XP_007899362.1/ PREDICTED: RWD domain-containing protein 2B [Callorhinchus milii]
MTSATKAEAQICELELLFSMFPNELVLDDQLALAELREYVQGRTLSPPTSRVQFTIHLHLDAPNVVCTLLCAFPPNYPEELPEISTRSDALYRTQQMQLNTDLREYLRENYYGEMCILNAIEWLKDHAATYINNVVAPVEKKQTANNLKDAICTRLWIYSHHIYNKEKRKNILEWAKELSLTGFSMPGKPGVVCVEGSQSVCEEFWTRLRRLTWQRILIRHREDVALDATNGDLDAKIETFRKFTNFEEKIFDTRGSKGNHMDLGQLYQFLNESGCRDIFQLYFGVEGKSS